MRFKITLLLALLFSAANFCDGQTRRPTPKPSASPQATAQPSSTPNTPAPQANADELSEAERKDLELQLIRAETSLRLSDWLSSTGAKPGDDIKKLPAEIAAIYEKAARDTQLAHAVMSNAFDYYFDKPSQSTARLLLLQSAQNQVLVEQNKKII